MKWHFFYVFLTTLLWVYGEETKEDVLADQFCRYLKSTPEPDVLIYNRVPKCGSKTVVELLKERHRKTNTGVAVFSTGGRHWSPIKYDSNATHLQFLLKQAQKIQQNKPKLILAGHWNWHNFRGQLGNRTVEHINVVRECAGRVKSQLFFDLFDEKNAKAAIRNDNLESYQSKLLGTGMTLQECMEDRTCIAEAVEKRITQQTGITHSMVHFLCGEICSSSHGGNTLAGAIANLNPVDANGVDVGGAVAIGELVYFDL